MICLNCGKEIDNDLRVCPFCGSFVEPVDTSEYFEDDAIDPVDNEFADEEYEEEPSEYYEEAPAEFTDDDPGFTRKKKTKEFKLPSVSLNGKVSLPAVLSALSLVLCLICLINVISLKNALKENSLLLSSNINSVQSSLNEIDNRLSGMDTTIAGVQSEAYNQLASQSITITKNITALTGPVTANKYNVMFIINAKGNLNLNDSFDWQRYNTSTGGWESLVFTGNATTNEQYGLRIANSYNKNDNYYVSELWANGITPEASGTYRCVITDATGIVKNSAEATVQVS